MTHSFRVAAKSLLLACFFVANTASAQTGLLDRVESVFDSIGQGLSVVGKRASDLVGINQGEKEGASFTFARPFNERYPVGPATLVSVVSEFGEVRVSTWANPVVQVAAEISVAADSPELAKKVAETIEIQVSPSPDQLQIRSVQPDTRESTGKVSVTSIKYTITVPNDAGLMVENSFGDTQIRGIGGMAAVDARYGLVDLRDINGPVRVRMRGEFALEARTLKQGGTFDLSGAHATLSNISGPLKVASFGGSVDIQDLAPETEVDVMTEGEGSSVVLHVPRDSSPDLTATSLFGSIESALELDRTAQGQFTVARSASLESKQHVSLRTSFGTIKILREGAAAATPPPPAVDGTLPFKATETKGLAVADGEEIIVDAIPGDIRITGVDENRVTVNATHLVRVQDKSKAEAALEALAFQIEPENGKLTIRSRVIDDMAALGCTLYRVDIEIQCPRACPLSVHAQDGHTLITGTAGPIRVEQVAGAISIEQAKGALILTNHRGDVRVQQCAGPLETSAWYGTVQVSEVHASVSVTSENGKVVMEALESAATVRNRGGDVRIIALEGVRGDYDIRSEQGNLSILLPANGDAAFDVVAENGLVYSAIPLTGTIRQGLQEFRGRIGEGSKKITLQAKGGDIRIN